MKKSIPKINDEINSLTLRELEELLSKLRRGIDQTDDRLAELLNERMSKAKQIGRIKKLLGRNTYDPQREKEIIEKIKRYGADPVSGESLLRIYERIIDESRTVQKKDTETKLNSNPNNKKIGFSELLSKKELLIITAFFLAVLFLLYYTFFTPNYYKETSGKFEIRMGATASEIAKQLDERGIIPSETNFKIAALLYGAERKIRAGRYDIPNGLSYLELLELFMYGDADFLREVKIFDGVSTQWIAANLRYAVSIDSADFYNLTRNKKFLDSTGIKMPDAEGYLLPKRYFMYENSSPREAFLMMYNSFKKFYDQKLRRRTDSLGMTTHEVVTLASIIQGESNNSEEMPLISAVYHNRLKSGMPLQADPTVQYALKGKWRRLLNKDLKIDSPYNTYKYAGLPPGPINNPGRDAIMAALYPADVKYKYFVADTSGGHKFAETYNEHLNNVSEYRKWINIQRKK